MLQKIENYKRAFAQLEDAVKSYLAAPQDTLYRDGLIQRCLLYTSPSPRDCS